LNNILTIIAECSMALTFTR